MVVTAAGAAEESDPRSGSGSSERTGLALEGGPSYATAAGGGTGSGLTCPSPAS